MAITRTSMVDDDGSGTTGTIINNAWKQELYNQIDAIHAGTTWTPTDFSGASLALGIGGARYYKIEKLIIIQALIYYPVTSNPNPASIAGLPFANGTVLGGFYSTSGLPHFYSIGAGAVAFSIKKNTGANYTNVELSGATLTLSGVYLTA